MIEYLLVFALGFCMALLFGLVVSPAIHRRVVTLTERRMRATVALTSAEVRAEMDAARAVHAMENRRLSVQLRAERGERGALTVDKERVAADLARERETGSDLRRRIEALDEEVHGLGARLREREELARGLETTLAASEERGEARRKEIQELSRRIDAFEREREESKIDIAARDTQIETLKSQIGMLRDERKGLREEVKAATEATNDLRMRLGREEERIAALDGKLAASIATLSDREGELERRNADVERLRERLAAASEQAAAAAAALEQSDAERRLLEEEVARLREAAAGAEPSQAVPARMEEAEAMTDKQVASPAITRRIEKLRKRHAALVGTLTEAKADQDDAGLRNEIAEIAAMMVDLTAAREGPASPIHGILAAADPHPEGSEGPSLAERSRRRIAASESAGDVQ